MNFTFVLPCLSDFFYCYVWYLQDTSGKYQYLTQQVDVQGFHIPGNCSSDIEKRIVAKYEVSRKHSLLGEKSVFLRMEFIQYLSATPSYTNDVGPFTFNKSSSSEGKTYNNVSEIKKKKQTKKHYIVYVYCINTFCLHQIRVLQDYACLIVICLSD